MLEAGDKGRAGLQIGQGNQPPHAQRKRQGNAKVGEGAQRVQAGAKGTDLFANRMAQSFGDDAKSPFKERRHHSACHPYGNQEDSARYGGGQPAIRGFLHDFRVRQSARRRKQNHREEDQRHGTEVEEALDDVDGDLVADR
jgi:hypothetical protein